MATLYFKQLLAGRDFGKSNPFAQQMENFIYLIGDRDTNECVVVDPAWDIKAILETANDDGMRITGALATHYHPDHIGGSAFTMNIEGISALIAQNPCHIHAHKLEADGIKQVTGVSDSDLVKHESGDVVKVGGVEIELLHTPGHTPGSMCFRLKNALISGDTLFLQGCGRVDLPGGDSDQMYETLTQRLSTIRDDVVLYPGHAYGGHHAPMSDVRQSNAMLRVKDINIWRRVRGQ